MLRKKQQPIYSGNVPTFLKIRGQYENEVMNIRLPEFGITIAVQIGEPVEPGRYVNSRNGREIIRFCKVAVFKNFGGYKK